MAEKKGCLYTVVGMVQGVGFRYFVERTAQSLGVVGYVRNLHDGTVQVYAEGEEDSLQILGSRLRRGPAFARVEEVQEQWCPSTGKHNSFRITF
jgi:acylphosphatase